MDKILVDFFTFYQKFPAKPWIDGKSQSATLKPISAVGLEIVKISWETYQRKTYFA